MPCGPPRPLVGADWWQAEHSPTVPAWPWSAVAATLSLALADQMACVLPWQASQASPPCPLLLRKSFPASSANRVLVARMGEAEASPERKAVLKRRPSAASGGAPATEVLATASFAWQLWQRGRSSQGRRALPSFIPSMLPPATSGDAPPTAAMFPWQFWQSTTAVMAPRRHWVVAPGWHW